MKVDWRWVVPVVMAASAALAWGASRKPAVMTVDPGVNGKITITVTAGEHWLRGGPDVVASEAPGDGSETAPTGDGPQVAIWLEDLAGTFVSVIYVTRRAATEDWMGVFGIDEGVAVTRRPLPVWAGKHRGIGVEPMASCGACHGKRRSDDKTTDGDPILQVLTGSAPTSGFVREWAVPERVEPGVYGIRVEMNHWMDPNEQYAFDQHPGEPDGSAGSVGSGQPSLVWAGVVEIGADPDHDGLALIGHGHPSGANGEVDSDLTGLTTALSIADTIHMGYAPAE